MRGLRPSRSLSMKKTKKIDSMMDWLASSTTSFVKELKLLENEKRSIELNRQNREVQKGMGIRCSIVVSRSDMVSLYVSAYPPTSAEANRQNSLSSLPEQPKYEKTVSEQSFDGSCTQITD